MRRDVLARLIGLLPPFNAHHGPEIARQWFDCWFALWCAVNSDGGDTLTDGAGI